MKILILALLLATVFSQDVLQGMNPACIPPAPTIPNCQQNIAKQVQYCNRLDSSVPYFFRVFYQCLYSSPNITHECAENYCKTVGDLEQFCVNCSDFSYNYPLKWQNATNIKPSNKLPKCDINTIAGCNAVSAKAEDYCQSMIGTLDPNYYADFSNCIKNQTQSVSGCGQCYCNEKQFFAFGVDCNSTQIQPVVNTSTQSNPSQKYKNISLCDISCINCCVEAVQAAEPQCQSSINDQSANYYQNFYTCMKTNSDVAAVQGCAECYCNGILRGGDDVCKAPSSNFLDFLKRYF